MSQDLISRMDNEVLVAIRSSSGKNFDESMPINAIGLNNSGTKNRLIAVLTEVLRKEEINLRSQEFREVVLDATCGAGETIATVSKKITSGLLSLMESENFLNRSGSNQ